MLSTRYTELESEHSTTQTGLETAHYIKQYTGLDSVHSITLLESAHYVTQTGLETAHSIRQYNGLNSVYSIILD